MSIYPDGPHDTELTTLTQEMDGRFFGGNKLVASLYNGQHYDKSDEPTVAQKEQENHEHDINDNERLQQFIQQAEE